MANAKLVVVLAAVLVLVQVSCGVARDSIGLLGKDNGGSSPAVNPHGTHATMTWNGFGKGEDGGDPSECDGKYHSDDDMLVALSTGWYAGGKRCHKKIRITSVQNKRTVEATVVDECDSHRGCKTNIVDTSKAVWKKLGLDMELGEVPVISGPTHETCSRRSLEARGGRYS